MLVFKKETSSPTPCAFSLSFFFSPFDCVLLITSINLSAAIIVCSLYISFGYLIFLDYIYLYKRETLSPHLQTTFHLSSTHSQLAHSYIHIHHAFKITRQRLQSARNCPRKHRWLRRTQSQRYPWSRHFRCASQTWSSTGHLRALARRICLVQLLPTLQVQWLAARAENRSDGHGTVLE